MSNVKRFFSYSPDGFELHETAEAAKNEAHAGLDSFVGEYDDCLDICWGEVRGSVHKKIIHHHGPECENVCSEGHYWDGEYDYVAECSLVDLPPTPHPEVERLRADVEAVQAEVEALREAWAYVREAVVECIEGDPYGNEAASLILDTMDAMVPEGASEALAPPPASPGGVHE